MRFQALKPVFLLKLANALYKQNKKSTEGCSKCNVRKDKDKFGQKNWSHQVEQMQTPNGTGSGVRMIKLLVFVSNHSYNITLCQTWLTFIWPWLALQSIDLSWIYHALSQPNAL